MRGRKPDSAKLQAAKSKDRPLAHADYSDEIPECPVQLSDVAKAEWFRVLPELQRVGVLRMTDRAVLAGYCISYADVIAAHKDVARNGYTIDSGDAVKANPAVSALAKSLSQLRGFAALLGFSPTDRARICIDSGGSSKDEPRLDAFVASKPVPPRIAAEG